MAEDVVNILEKLEEIAAVLVFGLYLIGLVRRSVASSLGRESNVRK